MGIDILRVTDLIVEVNHLCQPFFEIIFREYSDDFQSIPGGLSEPI